MMHDKLNILMLGGAKRLTMARHLSSAIQDLGCKAAFFSYELSPLEPIAEVATVIEGRRWADPTLQDHLETVVKEHDIKVIIPFVDGAIEPAAIFAEAHPEVYCPCCPPELSAALFDKRASARLFEAAGLDIPLSFTPGSEPRLPLIAKPRRGSASKGIIILKSKADLDALTSPANYLIQEYIPGAEEVTVDCFISRSGKICAISPRKRLLTLGGEVTRTITLSSADITEAAARAISALGLRGAVTLQYLLSPRGPLLMEINPRLGGGVTASIAAGATINAMIAAEALDIEPYPTDAEPDTLTVRCFHDITFGPDGHLVNPQ